MNTEPFIKPCLHCGGRGKLKGRKKHKVVCTKCGAHGAEKPLASQAVDAWNREKLVRCNDCDYFDETFFLCLKHNENSVHYEDDYCSRGKRKETK